jgi:beta-N-acetylhexosaminidase
VKLRTTIAIAAFSAVAGSGLVLDLSHDAAPAAQAAPTPALAASSASVLKPRIIYKWIPYGPSRRRQMAAYAKRHYGKNGSDLKPRVIVEHFTQTTDFASAFDTFRSNQPDVEFHELPGVCAHFLIDRDGRIYNLVPVNVMCRHTVGLNDRAIGVENVAMSDSGVMGNHRQLTASVQLARWLRCRFNIELRDVIGHNESLSSRWHHERVPAFKQQTHDDMNPATMRRFRQLVARSACG